MSGILIHMKRKIATIIRRVLPGRVTHQLEEWYRRARIRLVSASYGHPARKLKVIAVTGTNGKTTTATYINQILKTAGYKTAMFTTATIEVAGRSHINDLNVTVASTARMQQFFWQARHAHVDYVVLEVTSHALDQHKLDGVPVMAAVMTNLTQDHLDYHKTMEGYAAAKAKLFAGKPSVIILNRDDEWFEYYNAFRAGRDKLSYGTNAEADLRMSQVVSSAQGTSLEVALAGGVVRVQTALPGEFNAYNLTAAMALGQAIGVEADKIVAGIEAVTAVPGRFERAVEGQPYEVIVDYAHTPDALAKLLATARQLVGQGRVLLVFGACGDRDQSKRPAMGQVAVAGADRIFLTDEESYHEDPASIRAMIYEGIRRAEGGDKTTEISDRRAAIEAALAAAEPGDIILVTGMGHERFRIVRGQKFPWNDTAVIQELVAARQAK